MAAKSNSAPDDLILHEAQPLGAAAPMAILDQKPLGGGAPFQQRGFEPPRHRRPQVALIAAVVGGQPFEVGHDAAGVEYLAIAADLIAGSEHGAIAIAEPIITGNIDRSAKRVRERLAGGGPLPLERMARSVRHRNMRGHK